MGKDAKTRAASGYIGTITNTELKDNDKTKGFGVFAYYTEANNYATTYKPNFMYNQRVFWDTSLDTDAWNYNPKKYWPNGNNPADQNSPAAAVGTGGGKISFFAYAPFVGDETTGTLSTTETAGITAITANDAAGNPKVTFALGATQVDNVDLLWGTAQTLSESTETTASYGIASSTTNETGTTYDPDGTANNGDESLKPVNINLTKQTVGEKIDFLFKHALAKIGDIEVIAEIDQASGNTDYIATNATKVSISSISIATKDESNKIHRGGILNLATGRWDVAGNIPETFTYNITDEIKTALKDGGTSWDTTADGLDTYVAATSFTGVPAKAATSIFDTPDNQAFYFIPGDHPVLTITITYYTNTVDPHLAGGWSRIKQTVSQDVQFTNAFEFNKSYKLKLHLGLTSVKVEGAVMNWEDGESKDVYLPINVVTTP